ncbi:alkaline phosphatase family protein [Haloarcula terrestris]
MGRLGTAYLRSIQAIGRRLDYGTNVYEREWDVLVVLDACRADLLRSVAPEIDFLDSVETVRSVGSSSSEWLENTFLDHPETEHTAMVTGNTWTDRYLDAEAFAALDEVWKYAWDEELETVPAAAVTDRAIALARERSPERLVVHYMQPHHPFVPDPLDGDDGLARTGDHSNTGNPWVSLRRGEVSVERVWAAYEANLRYVLESVGTLLDNVDGRVAITADHGNLFGEWGLYGHPMHTPVPALLAVPWTETTGVDSGRFDPKLTPPERLPVSRVYGAKGDRDRLDALGYL